MPLITAITVNCEHVDHLEYAGVEDDHDETGDVEGTEGGVDDELGIVETTEVYLLHDDLLRILIMTLMMMVVVVMMMMMRRRRRRMTSSTEP